MVVWLGGKERTDAIRDEVYRVLMDSGYINSRRENNVDVSSEGPSGLVDLFNNSFRVDLFRDVKDSSVLNFLSGPLVKIEDIVDYLDSRDDLQ